MVINPGRTRVLNMAKFLRIINCQFSKRTCFIDALSATSNFRSICSIIGLILIIKYVFGSTSE